MSKSCNWSICVYLATFSVIILILGQVYLLSQPHVPTIEPKSALSSQTTQTTSHTFDVRFPSSTTYIKEINQLKEEKESADTRIQELEIKLEIANQIRKGNTVVPKTPRPHLDAKNPIVIIPQEKNKEVSSLIQNQYQSQCKQKYALSDEITVDDIVDKILSDSKTINGASNDIIVLGVGHSGTSSIAKMLQWYLPPQIVEHESYSSDFLQLPDTALKLNTWKVENEAGELGEDRRVNYINQKAISLTSIDEVMTMNLGGNVSIDVLAKSMSQDAKVRQIITDSLYAKELWKGYCRPCLLKDPRFVWTLDLWTPIFKYSRDDVGNGEIISGNSDRSGSGGFIENIAEQISSVEENRLFRKELDRQTKNISFVDYSLPVLIHVTRDPNKIQASHKKRKFESINLGMSLERNVKNKVAWAEWQLSQWINKHHGRYLSFDISSVRNIPRVNQKKTSSGGGSGSSSSVFRTIREKVVEKTTSSSNQQGFVLNTQTQRGQVQKGKKKYHI